MRLEFRSVPIKCWNLMVASQQHQWECEYLAAELNYRKTYVTTQHLRPAVPTPDFVYQLSQIILGAVATYKQKVTTFHVKSIFRISTPKKLERYYYFGV